MRPLSHAWCALLLAFLLVPGPPTASAQTVQAWLSWLPDSLITNLVEPIAGATPLYLHLANASSSLPSTMVRVAFENGAGGDVRIAVFDVQGRRVKVLHDGVAHAGITTLAWDLTNAGGARVSAGVYVVRATCPAATLARRIVVVR